MSVVPDNATIKIRADMLSCVRHFFLKRDILEVDVPFLLTHPTVDSNIKCLKAGKFYLPISTEFSLKKLLARGFDKIYSLGHVFRKEEHGRLHNVEFTMIEWYHKNTSFTQFLDECVALIALFLGKCKLKKYGYFELFFKFLNIKSCDATHSSRN